MRCLKCQMLLPSSDVADGHRLCFACFHSAIEEMHAMTNADEQQFKSMANNPNVWMNGDAARWAIRTMLDEIAKLRSENKELKEKRRET